MEHKKCIQGIHGILMHPDVNPLGIFVRFPAPTSDLMEAICEVCVGAVEIGSTMVEVWPSSLNGDGG